MELNINKIIIFILILIINLILSLTDKSFLDINVEINNKNNYLITHNISYNTKYINSSRDYWEHRYKIGGNSGVGSYNNLADFKAKVINNFIINKNIKTVIEWGSGDCNQLALANYKNYIGYDVSKTAIDICKKNLITIKQKLLYLLIRILIIIKKLIYLFLLMLFTILLKIMFSVHT